MAWNLTYGLVTGKQIITFGNNICFRITFSFGSFCWNILKLGLRKIVIVSYDSIANVNFSIILIDKKQKYRSLLVGTCIALRQIFCLVVYCWITTNHNIFNHPKLTPSLSAALVLFTFLQKCKHFGVFCYNKYYRNW